MHGGDVERIQSHVDQVECPWRALNPSTFDCEAAEKQVNGVCIRVFAGEDEVVVSVRDDVNLHVAGGWCFMDHQGHTVSNCYVFCDEFTVVRGFGNHWDYTRIFVQPFPGNNVASLDRPECVAAVPTTGGVVRAAFYS